MQYWVLESELQPIQLPSGVTIIVPMLPLPKKNERNDRWVRIKLQLLSYEVQSWLLNHHLDR